jgi:fermentation-respiration switch protein FrsA (DUF1100 family)
VALYAVSCLLAHFMSERMIFPRPPASYNLTSAHFFLQSPDGVSIAARYWPSPGARYTVLWFYGNGEDLGRIAGSAAEWQRRGFAVLATDYRGYGQSGGVPTERAICADASLALDWLRREQGTPPQRVIAAGFSVGTGPAVDLAAREPLAGLIVCAPFVSAYRVMTRFPLLLGDKFRNLAKMTQVRCPVLVIHGMEDSMIPVWHGQAIYGAVRGARSALWVEGAEHHNYQDVAGERYWQAIRSFTESLPESR